MEDPELVEKRLRASEARLRAILDSEPECVKTVSLDGRLLEMNPAGLRMIEADDAAAVLGQSVDALVHAEDRAAYLELHRRVARGETGQIQFRVVGLKGGERWMEIHSVPLRGEDGAVASVLSVTRDISERRQAEEALRASEDRYRDLVENSQDLICTQDLAGNLRSVNEAAIRATGYSREDLLRMNVADLLAPEARGRFDDHLQTLLAQGRASGLMKVRTATGETRYWEFDNTVRTEGVPDPVIRGMARDVTEARHVAAELRLSEAKFRQLADSNIIGVLFWDDRGAILDANDHFLAMVRYTREDLLGGKLSWRNLTPPEHAGFDDKALAEIRATGKCLPFEKEYLCKDGSRVAVSLMAAQLDDRADRGVCFVLEISDRKRAEAALRESEAKYRALVENMAEGLLLTDRDEIIRFVNPRVCQMLGYSETELLGQIATDLLFGEKDKIMMASRNRRRAEGISESYETEVRQKSGNLLWTSFSVAPVMNATGGISGSMAIVTDITERKRNEDLSNGQRGVLERIASGAPLRETLAELVRVLEAQEPEMICSVLLLDDDGLHLRHGAAPSLPADYIQAIDGLAIGPNVGSCGTAAFRREAVIVEDIATDPLWHDFRALARAHGLRACWSTPIFDAIGRVLGTFAIYYRQAGRPPPQHLRMIEIATQTAAIAIRHEQDESNLRRSEAQLHSFIENAPAEMAMFDNDMVCMAASRRWIGAYSRGLETPAGRSHYEVNPDLPERWKELHRRGLAGESHASDEDAWVQADGTHKWLRWAMEPWRDAQGAIGGLVLLVEDISARKQAEAAIAEEKVFSEALLDSLPGIFYLFDDSGRFMRWNRAFEAVSGYSAAEIATMHPRDFIVAEDRSAVEEAIQRVFEHGGADVEAALALKNGGRIPHFFTGARLIVRGTPCCIGTGVDLSARKILEAELQQSQKIEAIGRLAGGVAHDFNNILGVILGCGELAASELAPESPVRELVAEMVQAAERAATLTRQLLAFSRRQILQPRRLDLNELVVNAHKLLDRLIGEDIALVARPAPALGTVLADPGQIDQILLNLAINARDAMPKGGTLTLETANIEIHDDYAAEHWPAKPGRYVMIAISDTGIGMDAETQRRIFEPFFTTKPVGKGTGLGLATVYGIVKQSEGYIWVYSEPDLGTTFKICLPRVDELPDDGRSDSPREKMPGGHETVLLVEDNPALREVTRRQLAASGYSVLVAVDGEAAEALAGAYAGTIDLLLTDVVMPKLGGGELARRLTALRPGLPVLFMSGYTDGALAQHGVLEEGVALLEKPFNGEQLVRAVREILDR